MRNTVGLLFALFAVSAASASTGSPRIAISSKSVLIDEAVNVRVTGLPRNAPIVLEATTRDASGRLWKSKLHLEANHEGVVETRRKMLLFWSMRPASGTFSESFAPARGPTVVRVAASAHGRVVATGAFRRRAVAGDVTRSETTLKRDGFVGSYFVSASAPRAAAVVFIGGSAGGHGELLPAILASHGYPALSVGYFGEPGLPPTLSNIRLEYFRTALRWLAARPEVDSARIVMIGLSRGGEAAFLAAAYFPNLVHGVITCESSAAVLGAVPRGTGPAWTIGGKPVPLGPLPVERVRGPALVFGAGKDEIFESAFAAREIVTRARANGRPDINAGVYPRAGHGIGCRVPNVPLSGFIAGAKNTYVATGGTPAANEEAAAASWRRVLRFLNSLPY